MPLVREQAEGADLLFVDDGCGETEVNGIPVLSFSAYVASADEGDRICLAVADPSLRRRLASKCADAGLRFFDVRAPSALFMDDVQIGEGALFSPFSTVTSNVRIGHHFQCNLYSYVEHDCIIGDFVTFAPRVSCNGNVHVESGAYLGAGAVIRQGAADAPLVIGEGAVVGMGAVVIRNVPAGATVVGNPARVLESAP